MANYLLLTVLGGNDDEQFKLARVCGNRILGVYFPEGCWKRSPNGKIFTSLDQICFMAEKAVIVGKTLLSHTAMANGRWTFCPQKVKPLL